MRDQDHSERKTLELPKEPPQSSREKLHEKFFEMPSISRKVNPFDLRQPSLLRWVPTRASNSTK